MKRLFLFSAILFLATNFSIVISKAETKEQEDKTAISGPPHRFSVHYSGKIGRRFWDNSYRGFGSGCLYTGQIHPFSSSLNEQMPNDQLLYDKTLILTFFSKENESVRSFFVNKEDISVFSKASRGLGLSFIELIPGEYPVSRNSDKSISVNLPVVTR